MVNTLRRELTLRQAKVLKAVEDFILEHGYAPTIRQLGSALKIPSPSAVLKHLQSLERKGYIKRDPARARSIEIVNSDDPMMMPRHTVRVPVIGTVAAGPPLLAAENIEDVLVLPRDMVKGEDSFSLRIKGDSMIGAGIFDGDLVVVRQQDYAQDGDIVVALLEDEATVKYFRRRRNHIMLEPANERLRPIPGDKAKVIGKVVMSIREFS